MFSLFTNMKNLLFCLILCYSPFVFSQNKYWVFLADKDTAHYKYEQFLSKETIQKRKLLNLPLFQSTDIPLKKNYLEILAKNTQIYQQSRWLNAVCCQISDEKLPFIKKLPFVKELQKVQTNSRILSKKNSLYYDAQVALKQLEHSAFLEANLDGKGIRIGITDAGFYHAHKSPQLKAIFDKKNIVSVRDFVNPKNKNDYKDMDWDTHGTQVWERIAGKSQKAQSGMASESNFVLARTESMNFENRSEEANWIAALEWFDSLGVRLVNTSLGYALDFSNPSQNYQTKDMNGFTCLTSKAAQIAVQQKGVIIVVAAGNEGDDARWHVISSPADSPYVLSVGASDQSGQKALYSSIGVDFVDYVKPNVVCFSSNGTSFAAPSMTGFVACLLQKKPTATWQEIIKTVEQSACLYPYGNNYVGMGIPSAKKALAILENKNFGNTLTIKAKNLVYLKPKNVVKNQLGIVFHKKNSFVLLKQGKVRLKNAVLEIEAPKNTKQSSVWYGNETWEIIWE